MAREIWKIGKFDGGINSYTDPKDIKSDEFAELEDVNISKVGVAKPLGQPEHNASIHSLEVGNLIAGKGFYRFTSDNSFMPSLSGNSYFTLEEVEQGGGGTSSTATFGIKSLVWVFEGKPTAVTNIQFTLKVNNAAIMAPMTVLAGDLPQEYGADDTTTTNVFNDNPTDDLTEGDNDWGHWDDHAQPLGTAVPHQVVNDESPFGSEENPEDWDNEPGPNQNGAAAFWDNHEVGYNTNLNDKNLIFSATYGVSHFPTGTLSFYDHYMLGFYQWYGYVEEVTSESGNPISLGINNTAFHVPHQSFLHQNASPFDGDEVNYQKSRLSFMMNLIIAINAFSDAGSGTINTNFSASFEGAGLVEADDYSPSNPVNAEDIIVISSSIPSTVSGAITAELTCSSPDDATFKSPSNINLLTSSDRGGQGAGAGSAVDVEIDDYEVGNGMVLTGDIAVAAGALATVKTQWNLTIQGNSLSGDLYSIEATPFAEGTAITESSLSVQANYNTNQSLAEAIANQWNTTSPDITATASELEAGDEGSDDSVTAWEILFEADTAGITGGFSLHVEMLDSFEVEASAVGVSDEQFALLSKTKKDAMLDVPLGIVYQSKFDIYSEVSSGWFNRFSNDTLGSIVDHDYNKYLNWYYTANNDNDPIFWDEGSTLRIAETKFKLLNELYPIFDAASLEEESETMEANPNQWIGYKDLRTHFGDAFDYEGDDYGFFIGKSNKIWKYSAIETGADIGLTTDLNVDISSSTDFDVEKAKMRIHMIRGTENGIDWGGNIKVYAVACYDDGSESLPGHYFSTFLGTTTADYFGTAGTDTNTLQIKILFKPSTHEGIRCFSDARINGVRLYYAHSDESYSVFWNLGKIDFNRGFIKATTLDTIDNTDGNEARYKWVTADIITDVSETNITVYDEINETYTIEYLEMPKTQNYEDINGHSVYAKSLSASYKAACVSGRRTFIGNIRVWNGSQYEYFNDRMIASPINSLDTFPYPDNVLDLDVSDGDEIIALAAFGDKVMQFKSKIVYIMNIATGIASEFFVEERHRWKGIANRNHYCVTDRGIFWVNERGAWMYDGDELKDLFILGGDTDESQQRIGISEWQDFISEESLVGYNALSREVVIAKSHTHSSSDDSDCYVYSLIVDGWSKGKKRFWTGVNKKLTNIQSTGTLGKLSFFIESPLGDINEGGNIH